VLQPIHKIVHNRLSARLGHIGRQPLQDIIFDVTAMPGKGPFSNVRDFHNWLSSLTTRLRQDPSTVQDEPIRHFMPDDARIILTHADLHPSNIMVSLESPCRVLAIIDWHQSGWYPEYWEYCKAAYTSLPGGEWEAKYLPSFLEVPKCYDYWCIYTRCLGY
jgi:hypothetical protein